MSAAANEFATLHNWKIYIFASTPLKFSASNNSIYGPISCTDASWELISILRRKDHLEEVTLPTQHVADLEGVITGQKSLKIQVL